MIITEDLEFPQKIEGFLIQKRVDYEKKKQSQGTTKFQVHELVRCPRQTAFKRAGKVIPNPKPVNYLTLLRGEALHLVLQQFFPFTEVAIDDTGIFGHIDIYGDVPIELYTTNISSKDLTDEKIQKLFSLKIRQLLSYVHIRGCSYGKLVVWFLNGDYSRPINPVIKAWDILNTAEAVDNWGKLNRNRDEIIQYLNNRTVELGVIEPHFYEEYLDECEWCPYKDYCYSSEVMSKVSDEEMTMIGKKLKGGLFGIEEAV